MSGRSAAQASAKFRLRACQQKLQLRGLRQTLVPRTSSAISPRAAGAGGWTPLGPAPLASDASGIGQQDYNWVSGRATAVAVDPNDSSGNTVFVGGAYGGLWKSVTWNAPAGAQSPQACSGSANSSQASLLDAQPTLSVGAIAVQPQTSNPDPTKSVILVGTGETNSSTDSYYGQGILRSPDAGATWKLIAQDVTSFHSFVGIGFSQIAFDTTVPASVVAAAAGTSLGEIEDPQSSVNNNLGLYFSGDGGVTWSYASVADGSTSIAPGSATAVVYNAAAKAFLAALRFHGFYSSTDGTHWARLASQPGNGLAASACPPGPASQNCSLYRGALAVVPNRAGPKGMGEMYAWYVDANDLDQGIWQTVDGGATWTPVDEAGITGCGDLIGGCGTENGSYNLTLAAVPDNSAPNATAGTDLYAGAVNLYKCTILATATPPLLGCGGTGNTFLNLTHVYGCPPNLGSIAKVHPSQHAIDFLIPANNSLQAVMYFANDGGIYRALNGYSDLASGACGTPNAFESLNQTLGSITQFIALAQHPTDANTMLGGAQGNGSPATSESQVSNTWASVNFGEGGFSQIRINPDDSSSWFTENTGVNIEKCDLGAACHAQDFQLVVSNSTVGGDGGPLYTPYILDPQNAAEMIVGTCRVWRGTSDGIGFAALSPDFDTGTNATCTGNEINTIRSLAAGGSKDSNGFSSMIYGGTNGTGPLAASPAGGRIWAVSEHSDGSMASTDATGTINPSHFPISAVAVDPSDSTGNTAYVTVMGFHAPHVWKTANAGQSWTDFTGTTSGMLPDAPANSVLIDGSTVYVGSDVGVFASGIATPSWSEVGPPSGQSGFLPEVPVTALSMFNNGTTKILRAATYGRGVWQFPLTTTPDFDIAVADPSQTIFAGLTATFSGAISAFNGFSSAVTLTCVGQPPPAALPATLTCNFDHSQITPAGPTTPFKLSASGAVRDYSFAVQGVASGLTRNAPLTLHVIDFTLSVPSAVNVALGATSIPLAMQVGFLGSFPTTGAVTLSCTAPTGVTCSFFPSNSVTPLASGPPITQCPNGITPPSVCLTLAAAPGAQIGNSTITITASSSVAGTRTLNRNLSVTVTNSQDYALTIAATPATAPVGQNATLQGTVAALNGYSNKVQLSCGAGGTAPPALCTVAPAAVSATASGAAFTLTASSNTAGNYSFNVRGVGTDLAAITHSTAVSLTFFDFALSANPASQTVKAGGSATYTLSVTPVGLSTFSQAVTFNCSQVPALSNCSFTPSQIAAGSGIATVTLTISTTAATARLTPSDQQNHRVLFFALLLPLAMCFFGLADRNRRVPTVVLGTLLLLIALLPSCGGGGLVGGGSVNPAQPGTPPGTYTIPVSATEGSLPAKSVPLTLNVQ